MLTSVGALVGGTYAYVRHEFAPSPPRETDYTIAALSGTLLFIGAAGLAAHLPGVIASLTARPVIGIPLDGGALGGADALYSVVQMPPGVPVASVAIGSAGAKNAGHLAARILALTDAAIAERVDAFRAEQAGRAELRIDPRA
jgi:5-(carboxyamino)imidazole ribonucleotide mutase